MNDIKTAACYIRVSTDDQLEYSPESQLAEINAYCKREGYYIPPEYIFIEQDGKSGRTARKRDEFQRMIAIAKSTPRPFSCLLIWEFSRFARNQDESTFYKSILRKKCGIEVKSVKEPIPQGMYGRLIETIIEWQDEFYSINLAMEVTRSMRLKALKGYYNGKVPLGYMKPKDGNPVIIPEEAHIVKTIFDLYTTGYDKNYVIRYLNDKGYTTKSGKKFDCDAVNYILENPFYIGKIRWNRRASSGTNKLNDESEWIIADAHHDPIIDNETFEKAQERMRHNREVHIAYAHPVSHGKHWLSGMIKCPICGKSLSYKAPSRDKTAKGTFQCLGYRRGLHNESQSISERKLIKAVMESLYDVLDNSDTCQFDVIRTKFTDSEMDLFMYKNELKQLDTKYKRIKDAYINEIDSLEEYKLNRQALDQRKKELLSLIDEIECPPASPEAHRARFIEQVQSVIALLESDAEYELKGEALRSICDKIIFYKDTKTLEFYYRLII
jgi:site-specific DNA recombinase